MHELREILNTFCMWEQKGKYSEGELNILRACINEVKASIERLQETEEIKSAREELEEAFNKIIASYETHGIAYMREDDTKPFEPVAVCKE